MASPEPAPERRRKLDRGLISSDEPRYALILIIMLVLYVLVSFVDGGWTQPILFALAGVALVFAALPDLADRRTNALALGAVAVVAVVCVVSAIWPAEWRTGVVDIAIALTLLAAGIALVVRFLRRGLVTPATVFGAIDVYLLVGIAFSFLYHGIQSWSGDPYFAADVSGTRNTFTYFSFVSLTTLGYGDLTPASDAGRSVAVVEVILGQILLVTVIARFVSIMRVPGRLEES